MRRLLLISILAMLLLACASSDDASDSVSTRSLSEREITLVDGRTITCISYKAGYGGGLSCDW